MRLGHRCAVALLTALVLLHAGCVTQRQVERIVAESNAAMVGPYIDRARGEQGEGWAEAVNDIDRIIEQRPDQKVLVNHLRVRQAMLLTVHGEANLANAKWALVETQHLQGNSRDLLLYELREPLMWTYQTLPPQSLLNALEIQTANRYAQQLWSQAEGQSPDLAGYLRTLSVELSLKAANSRNDESEAIRDDLRAALQPYLEGAPDEAARWADSSPEERKDALEAARALDSARHMVWLYEMIGAYEREAESLAIPPNDLSTPNALGLRWNLVVTVVDAGAPVRRAVVSIESPRHGRHITTTGSDGTAVLSSVFPGELVVRANASRPDRSAAATRVMGYGESSALALELD